VHASVAQGASFSARAMRHVSALAAIAACLCASVVAGAAGPSAAAFTDPLDAPARMTPRALRAPVFALAAVDAEHVVAVGPRGHILRSADRGKTWEQRPAPVSTDLLAVQFPSPTQGWAVGHDGVVLHSTDGGLSWRRVLDGRSLGTMMVSYYDKKGAAADPALARARDDAKRMAEDGPTRPFLAVHFRDEREGWVVGQFNLILHTADGGATWEPWLDRTENPDGYSLHAIRQAGDQVVIVGELGLVMRLDAAAGRFVRIQTPYPGTWFGMAASKDAIVALGLRGTAWRSTDAGANWKPMATGTHTAINGGVLLPDGRLVLATQAGELLVGAALGDNFVPVAPMPGLGAAFDVVSMEADWLLVAGPSGVQRLAMAPAAR
jgi:photosystem II stability/assembly factor-like uncharacterized protein